MAGNFDLNFVNSDVDLRTVRPLDRRQLAASLNEWLLRAADTLNAFAGRAEARLLAAGAKLDSVDGQLRLLERKLANVPDRFPAALEATESSIDPHSSSLAVNNEPQPQPPDQSDRISHCEIPSAEPSVVQERSDAEFADTVAWRDHPRYAKYFTMLRIGIAEAAVRQKMGIDGLDPSVLSRPNERTAVEAASTGRRSSSGSSTRSFASD